jgi:hypothetical protein
MTLAPAVSDTLAQWHQMLEKHDLTALPGLIDPAAIFRSPMAYSPYAGAAKVNFILQTVFGVFEDFQYHRQFASGAHDVVLEFSARIGDKQLKGIDMIRFNAEGKIVDFEVMIRPASGLMALGEIMGKKLAGQA